MKEKYLMIDTSSDEKVWAIEISDEQLNAMRWLTEELEIYDDIRFVRVDSALRFEEI